MEPVEFQIDSVSGTFRDEYATMVKTKRKRYETNDDAEKEYILERVVEDQLKETISMVKRM